MRKLFIILLSICFLTVGLYAEEYDIESAGEQIEATLGAAQDACLFEGYEGEVAISKSLKTVYLSTNVRYGPSETQNVIVYMKYNSESEAQEVFEQLKQYANRIVSISDFPNMLNTAGAAGIKPKTNDSLRISLYTNIL